MKKWIAVIVVIVAIAIGAVLLTNNKDNTNSTTPNQNSQSSPQQATEKVEQTNAVKIENMAFSPDTIVIKKGTTVTWTNQDAASHTVTSDEGVIMNSELLEKGESYSVTFDQAGTFAYHCKIHPSMQGTVTVTE